MAHALAVSTSLADTVRELRTHPAIAEKIQIETAYQPAERASLGAVRLGDDCAALPDPAGGYLLLAAEGLREEFVARDPWFAGYCAVMVNISDVAAMGGRPLALTDVLWNPDRGVAAQLWAGMTAAAESYGVPVVGGHTGFSCNRARTYLAASIVGRAATLMTSFDAAVGDDLMAAIDLNGSYRPSGPFWNASVGAGSRRLRDCLELLPEIAESGLCDTAKDISNGGLPGTLIMLLKSSAVGAQVDVDAVPRPRGVDPGYWLRSFPSFGYLFSVRPGRAARIEQRFSEQDIACAVIGKVIRRQQLILHSGAESCLFWRRDA